MSVTTNGAVPVTGFPEDNIVDAEQRREAARQAYRRSVERGDPLSSARLADIYDRSRTWARERINEVRSTHGMPPTDEQADAEAESADQGAACHPAEDEAAQVVSAPAEKPQETTEPAAGMPQPRGARAVPWLAFVGGVVVSIAANVLHSFYPAAAQLDAWRQHGGTGHWQPEPGAVVGAGFWPLALLLAVEVLSRVRWRPGGWWNLARFGGTGLVAVVAAVLSYRHMAGLLLAFGEDSFSAHLGPLAVDGLMVVAGFALLSMSSTNNNKGS